MQPHDPFATARAAQRRTVVRAVLVVAGVGLVALLAFFVAPWLRSARPVLPGPLVAALAATSFSETADPATGWQRVVSAIPPGIVVAAAAVGRDGTLAMAFSRRGDVGDRVLAWRAGAYRVAHDTASDVTALAVSPEGETWIGTLQGGILIMRRDGSVVPSAQRTSGTSISQFAFDPGSGKTAVLISSGEVFTGLRGLRPHDAPLRPGSLAAVTLPPHARSRHVLYDDDGSLVLAGDAGAVFVATSSGWDDRTLAAAGDVAAIGLDGTGTLVAAQSNGHVWRSSGATWDAVGHVPHPPLAIGERITDAGRGLVVATDDGQLFAVTNESDSALARGYASTIDEPVFAAQIAGADVVFTSVHRVRIWDGSRSATWDSASERVTGHDLSGCGPSGARDVVSATDSDVVRCGTNRFRVMSNGTVAPAPTPATVNAPSAPTVGVHELLVAACARSTTPPCNSVSRESFFPEQAATVGSALADGDGAARVALLRLSFPSAIATTGLSGEPTPMYEDGGELLVRVHGPPTPSAELLGVPAPLVEVDFEGSDTKILGMGERAIVLRPGVVATVGADGPPQLLTLPAPGLVPTSLWREQGAIALAPHGDLALLVDQQSVRRILRCHADACRVVEGPPRDDAPMAVGFTADDHLYVITSDHDVAVRTR